jgi:hypothetical protein
MELSWIIITTLKLTRANLIRIKEALIKLITTNPELSAVGFLIVTIVAIALFAKYEKSS